jgi:biopolymer transport protein ExbD
MNEFPIQRRRRIDASFDLTPLIDVVFQLLIFLMISSQFKKPEAFIDLPIGRGMAVAQEERPDVVRIGVDAAGSLTLNGKLVAREELRDALLEHAAKGVVRAEIRGDRESAYGQFVEVLEEARAAGITSLGIVKKPEPETGAAVE